MVSSAHHSEAHWDSPSQINRALYWQVKTLFQTQRAETCSPAMAVFSLWSKIHARFQLQAWHFPVLFIIPLSHKNLKYMKMRLAAESSYCISRLRHRKRKHKAISCARGFSSKLGHFPGGAPAVAPLLWGGARFLNTTLVGKFSRLEEKGGIYCPQLVKISRYSMPLTHPSDRAL